MSKHGGNDYVLLECIAPEMTKSKVRLSYDKVSQS